MYSRRVQSEVAKRSIARRPLQHANKDDVTLFNSHDVNIVRCRHIGLLTITAGGGSGVTAPLNSDTRAARIFSEITKHHTARGLSLAPANKRCHSNGL
jgi:hypothetical protein